MIRGGAVILNGIAFFSFNLTDDDAIGQIERLDKKRLDSYFGSGIMVSDGIMIGNGIMVSDSLLISNGFLLSDSVFGSSSPLIAGDNGPSM